MSWLAGALRDHPELALFLALAGGYALGKIRFGSVQLGAVTGVLIAGVAIGQIGVSVSADLKSAFFLLFLFTIGYKTGPQFVGGLRSSGLSQIGLTLLLAGTGLGVAWALSRMLGFDAGTGAGLIAGGLTESATVGTAGDAIKRLGVDAATAQRLTTNVTIAFAVTYFLGVLTAMFLLSRVGPRLMGVDLAAECQALERQMGAGRDDSGAVSGYFEFVLRAYAVPPALQGKSVADLEALYAGARVFADRVRQAGRVIDARPDLVLAAGDRVTLSGRHEVLVDGNPLAPHEVDDRELLDVPVLSLDVVVTNKDVANHPLGALGSEAAARGVFMRKLVRGAEEMPFTPATVVARGDVVTLVGRRRDVERAAERIGYADRPTAATDMTVVGAAIVIGGLIGLPAVALGKLQIGLSLSVGVLAGGLFFGWLRSVDRRFGRIPEGALWFFDSVGLAAFLAAVGLSAGPDFVAGLKQSGVSLVVAGILTTAIPHLVTILVGRYLLGMHPGVLLGVCAGAGTSAPALAAVQEVAKSKIPTLGYGVTYAVGNVLLALWGTVIVVLLAR